MFEINFSTEELMTLSIKKGEGNVLLVSRSYAQKYSDLRRSHVKCLENLKERFERTSSASYENSTRSKNILNENNRRIGNNTF